MRRRFIISGLVLALVGAAVAAIAQPPISPTPPAEPAPAGTPKLPPAVIVPPAEPGSATDPKATALTPAATVPAPAEAPVARFEPLIAHPHQTQSAVRAVLLGANWMTRVHQPQGRFLYGYNPALRQAVAGDDDIKQARAALALARAARFTGDEKQAAMASQAVLALLAATKPDPADANRRVPIQSSMICNRVGFAAILTQAIHELPAPDARLLDEAERLCAFLRGQCRADGSVDYTDGPSDDPLKLDPAGVNEYPGEALLAIAGGNRLRPAAWKMEAAARGLAYYRARFKTNPHPLLAATLSPVCAELYRQSKSAEAAAALFEMSDWLCGRQIAANDPRTPQWAGGFRQADGNPPGAEVGLYLRGLACAYEINRHVPDFARDARYRAAVLDAAQFVCGLQYLEANTRHFENTFRANMLIGGFHLSPADGHLRVDATAAAVSGLIGFLSSGAEH